MQKTKIEWITIKGADYKRGYVAGMTEGDGTFRMPVHGKTYQESQWYWRIALKDIKILKRVRQYLRILGVRLDIKPFYCEGMLKIESRSFRILEKIQKIINPQAIFTDEFQRGYLAGIFDAEGNWHRSNLRIYNSDPKIIKRVINFASSFEFDFKEEDYPSKKANGARLRGDRFDQARFLCVIKSVKSRWYLRYIFWGEE